ncbi:MAG: RNA pyrophosphohydrolase [Inquilinaceae bacterium]
MTETGTDALYRPGVGLVLINPAKRIFIGRRIDTPDAWQMPQGGIDAGETPAEAALRELAEEVGTSEAEILAETAGWLHYDLPTVLGKRLWRGRFRGQRQKWFALRFIGSDADIDLNAHKPEFDAWKWADPNDVLNSIVPFKRPIYTQVLSEFAGLLR